MTDEDDFQQQLDARPDDWLCRLVLADWLQERGDPRAEGYRALGRLRLCPRRFGRHWMYQHCPDRAWLSHALRPRRGGYAPGDFVLPQSWAAAASSGGEFANIVCRSRRDADDAAARGFAELPAARRAKLLSLTPSPKPAPVPPTPGKPRRAPARKGWDKGGSDAGRPRHRRPADIRGALMDPRITSTIDHFRRTYLEGIPHTIRNETAFLSFVCMMAAIEGLAGFCEPDGSGPGANGPRFRSFVTTYFPHEYRPHAAGLWRLRNGLAHAFSPRGFLLTHQTAAAHLKTSSGVPCLNAEDFYAALKEAADAYFKALEESPELQSRFVRRWEGTSGGAFHVGEYDFD